MILILSALVTLGMASKFFRGAQVRFDDEYYSESDSLFFYLSHRADSLRLAERDDSPSTLSADPVQLDPAGIEVADSALIEESMHRVDLNTATQKDLESLPGIGPATAVKILRLRHDMYRFMDPVDLLLVPGIGRKKFAAIRPLITVSTADTVRKTHAPGEDH